MFTVCHSETILFQEKKMLAGHYNAKRTNKLHKTSLHPIAQSQSVWEIITFICNCRSNYIIWIHLLVKAYCSSFLPFWTASINTAISHHNLKLYYSVSPILHKNNEKNPQIRAHFPDETKRKLASLCPMLISYDQAIHSLSRSMVWTEHGSHWRDSARLSSLLFTQTSPSRPRDLVPEDPARGASTSPKRHLTELAVDRKNWLFCTRSGTWPKDYCKQFTETAVHRNSSSPKQQYTEAALHRSGSWPKKQILMIASN